MECERTNRCSYNLLKIAVFYNVMSNILVGNLPPPS